MERLLKKIRSLRGVDTYLGFPVDKEGESESTVHRKKGIAMLVAVMVIAMMMLFTADLILTSQVNLELSTAQRDNLKAEYLARSAVNAALLLLSADFAFDLFQAQQNPKVDTLQDGLGDFWSAMNGFPIGGDTADMLAMFQESMGLSKVLDGGVMQQLKEFDGSFVVNVIDEGQKINVNYCHSGRCNETLLMLESLFSCPAEKMFMDSKNVDPKELAYKIKDWVDDNSKAESESGVSDEGDPYYKREPKVRPKNAPFDSLDELKLVDGWDEEIHEVFSPYLTIWPLQQKQKKDDKPKININTASRALLSCIFPNSISGDCAEKSALLLAKRNKERLNLSDGKKVPDVLRDALCYTGGAGNEGEASNRAEWFTMSSMVFRVEGKGTVGDQEKTLTAIIQRRMPDLKKKEKTSYEILYWKMI